MKNCTYCGRENTDEAAQCLECGTEFVNESGTSRATPPPVPDDPARTLASKRMVRGAMWFTGGIVVTLFSYIAAASSPFGGTYIIAWGAVVFGAVQFIRGWRGKDTRLSAEDIGYEALATGTQLETAGRVQEALTVYQRVAEEYPDSGPGRDAKKSIESLQAKLG